MANEENGGIIDPNKTINENGEEVILKEGDEGFVKPEGENKEYSPESKLSYFKRQTEQLLKKYPELAERENSSGDEKVSKRSKKDEFDYGEKAFLIANGLKEVEEMDLVKKIMKDTGKSLEGVVNSKYFQSEVKEMREVKASTDAMPKSSNRSSNSQVNEVEYWLAKGELPPANQVELRRQVVNERLKKEKNINVFTDTPLAGSGYRK